LFIVNIKLKRRVFVKKFLIFLLTFVLAVSMILIGTGCKTEAVVETTAAETVAETTAAETTAVETTAAATTEDMNALDPWTQELWNSVDKYRVPLDPSFNGPNGETVTWDRDSLKLTVGEVEKIRAGNYTVGLPWGSLQGDYFSVWRQGTLDACEYLNLEIVAETDAGFDPAKQKSDVESMIQLKPDVLICAPTDAITGAASFKPAVDAGILLSFVSIIPTDYVRGKDYIGCTTANAYGMGITACELAKQIFGEGGKIGLIHWSFEYWFTNYHDQVIRDNIEKYGLEIVDYQGFVTPDDASNVTTAMIMKYPEIEGFDISYMTPAIAVAEACVSANRPDLKIITGAYDAPTLVNMATGGNIKGFYTDTTYLVGVNSVLTAAYGLLGKEGPEYAVCPTLSLTQENIREVWDTLYILPLPKEVDDALKAAGY
jgi:ribose transport system substrate-binding protein